MRRRSIAITCVIALVLPFISGSARADQLAQDKIDPALLQLMSANAAALLPVIVEMTYPDASGTNASRAGEATDLLRAYGRAAGALTIIDAAAGFADAAGIEALSLVPTVAYIHYDATVRASADRERRSSTTREIPPPPTVLPTPAPVPTPTLAPLPTETPSPTPILSPVVTPPPTPPPTPTPTPTPAATPAST